MPINVSKLFAPMKIAKRLFNIKNLNFHKVDQLLNEVMRILNTIIAKLKASS